MPCPPQSTNSSRALLVPLQKFVFLFIYVWMRGTRPRFRYDPPQVLGWSCSSPSSWLTSSPPPSAILGAAADERSTHFLSCSSMGNRADKLILRVTRFTRVP